jgi:hypothetical protein
MREQIRRGRSSRSVAEARAAARLYHCSRRCSGKSRPGMREGANMELTQGWVMAGALGWGWVKAVGLGLAAQWGLGT